MKKAKSSTKKTLKSSKTLRRVGASKPQEYQLRALGWCVEVTAHKLNNKELKLVREHCEESGIDLSEDVGNLEDVLDTYNMYDTNMWQTGTVPVVGSTSYGLYDSQSHEIFMLEDIHSQAEFAGELYEVKKGAGNVVVVAEEHKGTSAVWVLQTIETPKPEDFEFKLGRIVVGDDETEFVESVFYKGQELDKDYDAEFIVGKAFSSRLF